MPTSAARPDPAVPAGTPGRALRRRIGRLIAAPRLAALGRWLAGVARDIRRRRAETRLTVAVDINSYFEPLTGIGWYLHETLRHLAARDDIRLRLYAHRLVEVGASPRPAVALPEGPAIDRVRVRIAEDTIVPAGALARLVARLAPLLVALDRNDVVFAPNYLSPPIFRWCGAPLVATIHDLTLYRWPDAVRPDTRVALTARLAAVLDSARMILTPSASVREELIARGVPSARVRAIHHGPGQASATIAGEPGVAAPYVLCVGTIEPRKNLGTLLAAWRLLRQRTPTAPRLVLCGRFGWGGGDLGREIAAAAAEGWLEQLEYVTSERLAALYRGARWVVFPTLYEGFGLPAVEAMAAGTPLQASDIPVLREVAGDAALFVPPLDVEAWATTAAQLDTDSELRRTLAGRGRERAAAFSWDRAAEATAEALRAAARR